MNGLSVLKLFQLLNVDLLFSMHAYNIYKVHRVSRLTKLGHDVQRYGMVSEVSAGFPKLGQGVRS